MRVFLGLKSYDAKPFTNAIEEQKRFVRACAILPGVSQVPSSLLPKVYSRGDSSLTESRAFRLRCTAAQVTTLPRSHLAEFSRQRAQQEAQLVDPAILAHAVSENVEAQIFCLWARLSVYIYGLITPVLRSYLDERCPGFAQTVSPEESRDVDDLEFWRMLRKWIDTHVFGRATAEGWNHALDYYTAADPAYKKAHERWLETKRALESGTLTEVPLYEFWRDADQAS